MGQVPSFQKTLEDLKVRQSVLQEQMRDLSPPSFGRATGIPRYEALTGCYNGSYNGFGIGSWAGVDPFIKVDRDEPRAAGEFAGDKFHLSVSQEDVPRAFEQLSGLLFSQDSPIDKWKISNQGHQGLGQGVNSERSLQNRVKVGAQFTLYVKPDTVDSTYTAEGLSRTRHFVEQLEKELEANGIAPGERPASDVFPDRWRYTSYRNERRSVREGSPAMLARQREGLASEPFYQLMTQ